MYQKAPDRQTEPITTETVIFGVLLFTVLLSRTGGVARPRPPRSAAVRLTGDGGDITVIKLIHTKDESKRPPVGAHGGTCQTKK